MNAREARKLLVLANAFKEGDLAVGGTRDDRLRADARRELLAITLGDIRRTPLVEDGISAALDRSRDRRADGDLDPLTIAEVRSILLGPGAAEWVRRHQHSLSSEAVAAIAKVLTGDELSSVARAVFNPLAGTGVAIGGSQHFGSRIQPNSPGDDEQEILYSVLEGLSFGCGDVILGLNPAADDVATIDRLEQLLHQIVDRLELPTRFCVLSDILKQQTVLKQTHVDVGFQSLAGTSTALAGMVGLDADGLTDVAREFEGLYFETGQGSAVTNGAAEDVDMVTLESRAYGLARHIRRETHCPWMIVNDVAGFIGPEVFRTAEQLERACLEDTVMAKLHGLTMGLDVCATFHMGIAPGALSNLTTRIAERAAPAYLMAVAGNADPMLGYLTTSFRDHGSIRRQVGRRIATPMQQRLTSLGALASDGSPRPGRETVARLYAAYAKAGGDERTSLALEDEARRRLAELQARGFDLGGESDAAGARVDALYTHARAALYATLDQTTVESATSNAAHVRTQSSSRDDYLAHPTTGERLVADDARAVARLPSYSRPQQIQVVVSDGLNARAVNEHLPALLPRVRWELTAAGFRLSDHDIVVRNGRVRAGYEIGGLVGADIVVHLIGERPGTGLNTLSAYITYGRDEGGQPRWSPRLDHSLTSAICGIHPRGKPPQVAAAEIVRMVVRIAAQKRSGVTLSA